MSPLDLVVHYGAQIRQARWTQVEDVGTGLIGLQIWRLQGLDRPMFFVPGNHDASNIDAPENIDGRWMGPTLNV